MIARPRFTWNPTSNIDTSDGIIAIEIDIDMLETLKQTLRKAIKDLAETYRYEDLQETVNSYLQLEQLSIIYDTVMEGETDDKETEGENDVNVSEDQRQ